MKNGLYLYKCSDGDTLVRRIEFIGDKCYCKNGFPNGTKYCALDELMPLPSDDYAEKVRFKEIESVKWK